MPCPYNAPTSILTEGWSSARGLGPRVVVQREPDPVVEVSLGLDRRGSNVHPAAVFTPLHDHRAGPFPLQRGVVQGRIDAAHDPALADADAHLAADHERHAAEHPLLLEAGGTG